MDSESGKGRRTGVKLVEGDAELAQAGEELRFGLAVDGVVDALVRRRLDVAVRAADAHHLGDFPAARPWAIKVRGEKEGREKVYKGTDDMKLEIPKRLNLPSL